MLLWSEEEEGGRRRKEGKSLVLVAREASLADWLVGKCGVLDFCLVNQGYWRHD